MNKGFDGEPSISGALAPEVHLAGQAVRFTPTICPQARNSIRTSPPRPPNGYHTATPYLTVTGADQLIVFLTQVFGARETERVTRPDGKIAHADVRVGDSVIMLAEASTSWPPMPGAIYSVRAQHGYHVSGGAPIGRRLADGARRPMPRRPDGRRAGPFRQCLVDCDER